MTAPAHKYRVLVVDDEESVCHAVRMILEFCGYEVQTASTGLDAMKLLEKGHFDLLVTDYMMRGMNGQELAKRAKDQKPRLPVLMVTAFADSLNLAALSADAILSKPFKIEDLRDIAAKLLPPGKQTPPPSLN